MADASTTAGLQRILSLDGAATRAMEGLTGGAVLAGLLLALGAGDVVIALVAAIPFLAQIAQFASLRLAFRWRSRRKLCMGAAIVSRSFLLASGLAVAFLPGPLALWALVTLLACSAIAAAVAAFSWAYWMRDLVPGDEYGKLFARRFAWQSAVALCATLAAGLYLTSAAAGGRSFALLLVIGSLLGLAGVAIVARIPDMQINPADGPGSLGAVRRLLGSGKDRAPVLFAALWGAAATMAVPFIPVFLLRDLHASYLLVASLGAVSVLSALTTAPAWGRMADRVGAKPILSFGALASGLALLGLVLAESTSAGSLVLLAGVHVVMGATLAAVEIALGKLTARSAPFNRAGTFLATAGLARAMGAGAGILLAGLVAGGTRDWSMTLSVNLASATEAGTQGAILLRHYDAVFVLSSLLMLYAAHRVLALAEPQARKNVDVLRELHVELAGLSPFRGARAVSRFAHHAANVIRERRTPTLRLR